jgi:3',5'-cyclic AMP phosphodiesterase CpdA
MERRNFLRNLASLGAIAAMPSCISKAGQTEDAVDFVHSSSEFNTTILSRALPEASTILHITDTHCSVEGDETEEPYITYSKWMHDINGPATHKHYRTGEMLSPLECFAMTLAMAKERRPDLLMLTGDIINYPSEKCVTTIMSMLEEAGIPWIYTAGNHDWYYPDIPGEADALRTEWIQKRLLPFYQGSNPMFGSRIHKGVNLVTIDNSTGEVNAEQLDFYRQQKKCPEPIALFMHIPLYNPPRGERRNRDGEPQREPRKENPETIAFREEVFTTPLLAGIFVGHTHEHRITLRNGKMQYVTSQGADGRFRYISFRPLNE